MDVQKALDDTGRKLAVMAAQEGEDHEKIVGMAAANVLFKKNIKKSDNINHYVVNKVAGINLLKSKFTEDKIYLVFICFYLRHITLLNFQKLSHAPFRILKLTR